MFPCIFWLVPLVFNFALEKKVFFLLFGAKLVCFNCDGWILLWFLQEAGAGGRKDAQEV